MNKSNRQNPTIHIVVDMLYDFIHGSLACKNSDNAVRECIEYINNHPEQKVLYVCDAHPSDHCSFKENGGTWVAHCIKGEKGQEIDPAFFSKIIKKESCPNKSNIFEKGKVSNQEQYSGYEATNSKGEYIHHFINKNNDILVISGIATEFCVKETASDFLRNGYRISLLSRALAYVSEDEHQKTLKLFDLV